MRDEAFYAPNHRLAPRQPVAGELLFEFVRERATSSAASVRDVAA